MRRRALLEGEELRKDRALGLDPRGEGEEGLAAIFVRGRPTVAAVGEEEAVARRVSDAARLPTREQVDLVRAPLGVAHPENERSEVAHGPLHAVTRELFGEPGDGQGTRQRREGRDQRSAGGSAQGLEEAATSDHRGQGIRARAGVLHPGGPRRAWLSGHAAKATVLWSP